MQAAAQVRFATLITEREMEAAYACTAHGCAMHGTGHAGCSNAVGARALLDGAFTVRSVGSSCGLVLGASAHSVRHASRVAHCTLKMCYGARCASDIVGGRAWLYLAVTRRARAPRRARFAASGCLEHARGARCTNAVRRSTGCCDFVSAWFADGDGGAHAIGVAVRRLGCELSLRARCAVCSALAV